jgi:hypothetical protein
MLALTQNVTACGAGEGSSQYRPLTHRMLMVGSTSSAEPVWCHVAIRLVWSRHALVLHANCNFPKASSAQPEQQAKQHLTKAAQAAHLEQGLPLEVLLQRLLVPREEGLEQHGVAQPAYRPLQELLLVAPLLHLGAPCGEALPGVGVLPVVQHGRQLLALLGAALRMQQVRKQCSGAGWDRAAAAKRSAVLQSKWHGDVTGLEGDSPSDCWRPCRCTGMV